MFYILRSFAATTFSFHLLNHVSLDKPDNDSVYPTRSTLFFSSWIANHPVSLGFYLGSLESQPLTHSGQVTHISVDKITIIGSDNCLPSGRHQSIIWASAGTLLIRTTGTNSEILSEINTFLFKKCIWKCRLRNGGNFASASMCQWR